MDRRLHPNRIDYYIFGQLFIALLFVTAGLVALIWLTQSLRFIQIIVNHGLSPLTFIKLTLLLVPSFVATILPITCFIVVLFVYARLGVDRELTVMRATGRSDLALARPALVIATGAMLCCYALNIVVVPASLRSFRNYEFEIRNQIAAFLLQPGVFTPVTDHVTVYVQSRGPNNTLSGILIEDDRDRSAPATILARSGQLMVNAQGPVVLLQNGSREQIDPKTGRLDVLTFERNVLSLAKAAQADTPEMTDSAEASLPELLHPSPSLSSADQAKWLVEGHRRLTAPLAAISYTMIGLLATLSGVFRRHGGLLRPVGAVISVTLLVALSLGVNNLAARNLDLLPLIWVTIVLPGVVAGLLLFTRQSPR
ncbi:MAG TPA: LPS export ABC transporter permease LptF [Acidocella sp.]|nr:LPS export ABC transporter permease LptF [Acidocella sp.]